jgi:hypothetical protein
VALLQQPLRPNDCHLSDLLAEEQVLVSPSAVRRIRLAMGLPARQRRRPPRHYRRREREGCEGAMVLIDGSEFAWLGAAHGTRVLVGTIDDASGKLLALTFRPGEDLHGYAVVLEQTVRAHGVPLALYGDETTIAVRSDTHWTTEEELQGCQNPTQFGAMLQDLDIRYIRASSPQAKGRIERVWRTLQDRLTTELALQSITTWEAAEAFLAGFIERFNRQLARTARSASRAWRRMPPRFDQVLACRYTRTVGRDNVVRFFGAALQLPPGPHRRSYHGRIVEVREGLNGRLQVRFQGQILFEQEAPPAPFTLLSRDTERARRIAPPRNDAPASRRIAPSPVPKSKPKPQPRQRLGQMTNIRRPAANHPWKGLKTKPNPHKEATPGG